MSRQMAWQGDKSTKANGPLGIEIRPSARAWSAVRLIRVWKIFPTILFPHLHQSVPRNLFFQMRKFLLFVGKYYHEYWVDQFLILPYLARQSLLYFSFHSSKKPWRQMTRVTLQIQSSTAIYQCHGARSLKRWSTARSLSMTWEI